MPQFGDWPRPLATWSDDVRGRHAELRRAIDDLIERGREAANAISSGVTEFTERARDEFEQARGRVEQMPVSFMTDLRRRMNLLELATVDDVAVQSKIGRNRVSFVLKEFLEEQRGRDEALIDSLRVELREELAAIAAAMQDAAAAFADDAFDVPDPPMPVTTNRAHAPAVDDDDDSDEEDDDFDGTCTEVDLAGDAPLRALVDATDE
jgi:uncharacterized membrane protein YccC